MRPVTEADYFEGDVPLIRGFSFYRNKILREITRIVKGKTFTAAGMIGTKISPDDPLKLVRDVKIAHTPRPINRQDFACLMERRGGWSATFLFECGTHRNLGLWCSTLPPD